MALKVITEPDNCSASLKLNVPLLDKCKCRVMFLNITSKNNKLQINLENSAGLPVKIETV